MLQNIGKRNGRRSEESRREQLNQRGDARLRMVDEICTHRYVHEDAQAPRQELIARSERIFNGEEEDSQSEDDHSV